MRQSKKLHIQLTLQNKGTFCGTGAGQFSKAYRHEVEQIFKVAGNDHFCKNCIIKYEQWKKDGSNVKVLRRQW